MHKSKICILTVVILIVCILNISSVLAMGTYQSYYYTRDGNPIDIEAPFICDSIIVDFNGQRLNNPNDILVHNEYIFITDTNNNRILKLNSRYNVVLEIKEFTVEGAKDSLNSPQSIFITDNNHIYVADTSNRRIVVFDYSGKYINQIRPLGQEFDDKQQPFIPTSLVIEKTGRLLVNSRQIYKGIIAMNPTGEFLGYFGANRARISPFKYFWKSIATREQREGMILDIPTEIAKIHLDKDGFPYVISNTYSKAMSQKAISDEQPVRRLNLIGDNILNFSDSDYYPIGDIQYILDINNNRGASNIVDICTTNFGIYFLLDSSKGRIFAYNQTGRNIFTFAGSGGLQYGTLKSPVALDMYNGSLLVLDRCYGSVSVFKPTNFGQLILKALEMHNDGEYDEAKKLWEQMMEAYGYYDLAYLGIGKVLLYEHKYEEAMKYFEEARDREYYSLAFKKVRKNLVEKNFLYICITIVLVLLFISYGMRHIKKRVIDKYGDSKIYNEIAHIVYTTLHPFKGFYEIKANNKGSYVVSIVLFVLLSTVIFLTKTAAAFLFRVDNASFESLLKNVGSILLVIILWMVVLYLMEIFLEGEAKLNHIIYSTAIALFPAIIAHIIAIIFTYGASLDDTALINAIIISGWIWTAYLIFTGVLVTNDYTMTRTMIATFVNVIGMAIVFILSILFISLLQDMLIFVSFTMREIKGVFGL